MGTYLTSTERRLTTRARRMAKWYGRRVLGLCDAYSGKMCVAKLPLGEGHAYMVTTADGGTGTILGRTALDAEMALSDLESDARA